MAAANSGMAEILLAGFVAQAAGAKSMAVGEYISISSQSDTELKKQWPASLWSMGSATQPIASIALMHKTTMRL